jgi:hypothetical protein
MTLAAWTCYCLDVPTTKATVPAEMGDGSVRHIQFQLNKGEQSQFLTRPVKVVRRRQINQDLWRQVMDGRKASEANSFPGMASTSQ